MLTFKGTLKNGLVYPSENITEQNGKSVIITLVESSSNIPSIDDSSWDSKDWEQFDQLIQNCTIDTETEDLAHQHDHYIHGTPKRESYP